MFIRLCVLSIILSSLMHSFLCIDRAALAQKKARSGRLFKLGWAVLCKFQPVGYDCSFNETSEGRFYYDTTRKGCMTYEYSECEPSYNNFLSLATCLTTCRYLGVQPIPSNWTASIYCRFQPEFGDCNSYFPMFYFDVTLRKCKGFSYSGCGGNHNRFANKRMCAAVCGAAVPYPKNAMVFMTEAIN